MNLGLVDHEEAIVGIEGLAQFAQQVGILSERRREIHGGAAVMQLGLLQCDMRVLQQRRAVTVTCAQLHQSDRGR
ncbi:hypothetical protein [Thauera humireducens]|uniref:hypothetical protein n=1 Tax=Thauera humireducens TaxID=1134435 RepID=UPI003C75332C